jgi:UDPglucose 6-dehydrogenase
VSQLHSTRAQNLTVSLIFVSVNTPTKKSGIGAGFAADLK